MTEEWKTFLTEEALSAASCWQEPCEAMFRYLVEQHPWCLYCLVRSRCLKPSDQTFAAEVLGQFVSPEVTVLLKQLALDENGSPVVREGALYGLYAQGQENLVDVAESFVNSSSPGLRSIGKEVNKYYE
jgi:hypothetical protein